MGNRRECSENTTRHGEVNGILFLERENERERESRFGSWVHLVSIPKQSYEWPSSTKAKANKRITFGNVYGKKQQYRILSKNKRKTIESDGGEWLPYKDGGGDLWPPPSSVNLHVPFSDIVVLLCCSAFACHCPLV